MFNRILPWLLIGAGCCVGLFFPLSQESQKFRTALIVAVALCCLLLLRLLIVKPSPVVILDDDSVVIRGVKPGVWKLFQLWHTKRIKDEEILSIRMGYLRGKKRFILFRHPPGEPSRNAMFQLFLWITYIERGDQKEIYYPHMKSIKHYDRLVEHLQSRFGSKCEENLKFSL
jgi:hypothetical protein